MTALGAVGLAAPSYADSTVTVQGTAFPDPARANLSFVGCADLYQRTDEVLAPTIGVGPGVVPAGTRSLGWDLAGGNAVGAAFPVDSMLTTAPASIAVNASARATGVAYAGYQEPADAGTGLLWIGRSALTTPGGAWQTVDATTRLYTWAKYDMTTRRPVATDPGGPAPVAAFVATHGGDGPGIYTIGFGCDGVPFSMDALRVGPAGAVTTYDVEALRTAVSIDTAGPGGPGDGVVITGEMHTLTGDPVPHATMVLERRAPDSGVWRPVAVADVDARGQARVTVSRAEPAFYRWRFVERPLAEGSTSTGLLLEVLAPIPTPLPSPSATPEATPTGPPPTPSNDGPTPSDPASPSDSGSLSVSPSVTMPPTASSLSDSGSPTSSGSAGSGDESDSASESDSHGTS